MTQTETDQQRKERKENARMYLYYSRQNDMAFAVFDWIRLVLDMDSQDLWKFFFEMSEVNYRMLDAENKFSYAWNSGQGSPLGWKTDRSSTRPKILPRTPMSLKLSKQTSQAATPPYTDVVFGAG
jgi:hypothetical protein